MWSVFLVLKTTISYTLFASYKVGQFIVTTLYLLLTKCLYVFNKLLILLTVIIEDFTIFIQDVIQNINNILVSLSNGCEQIINGIYATWECIRSFLHFIGTSISSVHNAGVSGILTAVNGVKAILIYLKQLVIMFGDGVWFIVVHIPKSTILLIISALEYSKSMCLEVLNDIYFYIKYLCYLVLESVFDCYQFLTDVPTESFIGIIIAVCFLYIFIQFYTVVHVYLQNKMSSFLSILRRKYNNLKRTFNRMLSNSNRRVSRPELHYTPPSTKSNSDSSCIICQDYPKCVLLLPCKHLCLCSNCTPRLMRYTRQCPICRKPINSTMQVFT